MNRNQFVGHWICWPYSFCDARAEQHLYENGRFEAKIDADELKIHSSAMGKWDLVDGAIQWTYESAKKITRPRRPQIDKILFVEENRFISQEGKSDTKTEFWRGGPCDETSTNFDLDEVQPFLKRLVKFVDSGFTSREITSAMKKIRNLERAKRLQMVFPITYRGLVSPFYLGVFMDDIDAPDICFSGPTELVQQIDDEIEKLRG